MAAEDRNVPIISASVLKRSRLDTRIIKVELLEVAMDHHLFRLRFRMPRRKGKIRKTAIPLMRPDISGIETVIKATVRRPCPCRNATTIPMARTAVEQMLMKFNK